MSEKKVLEIIQGLNDRSNLEKDLEEAISLISGHFRDKYLERLNYAFNKCRKSSALNPSKELQLMNALRPFIPQERHDKIDNITEMLTLISTFENIRNEAKEINTPPSYVEDSEPDPAIHEDGIYEVDERCLFKKNRSIVHEEPRLAEAATVSPNFNLAGLMLIMGLANGKRNNSDFSQGDLS